MVVFGSWTYTAFAHASGFFNDVSTAEGNAYRADMSNCC
jgi:hypothetical protein